MKQLVLCTQQIAAEGKQWESLLVKNIRSQHYPRKASVALFRLVTGHDFLYKHLKRIGIKRDATCPLCNREDQDAVHILDCQASRAHRLQLEALGKTGNDLLASLYWLVREQNDQRENCVG